MMRRCFPIAVLVFVCGVPLAQVARADTTVTPPPAHAKFDYQIGAAYTPPDGVTVVSRDRNATPAAGLYNICYVNGFQTQPAEQAWWQANHDDLLLKNADGSYVIDPDWNEILFDISTPEKRDAIAAIVNGWIDGCATAGFQAVELDNLDSYTRSAGLITQTQALDFASLLITHAHNDGLAIGQKNTLELGTAGRDAGLDFAVVEECGQFNECGSFAAVYGDHVIDIEYNSAGFTAACTGWAGMLSIVLRDRAVTAPGSATYVYDAC